jgi:mannose-6-phosphate isomerase-like protein (cupin superfamily)
MRVVITGHDAAGRSIVVSDERKPDRGMVSLFTTGGDPADIGPPSDAPHIANVPPSGSASWIFVDNSPEAEMRAALSAGVTGIDADGWHATPTVDYVLVVRGPVVLSLDTAEVLLNAGDCVVQRGTRHAWRNHTDTRARLACVMIRP